MGEALVFLHPATNPDLYAALEHWWPQLSTGDCVAGNGYGDPAWPGVASAVDRFAVRHSIALTLVADGGWVLRPEDVTEVEWERLGG